MSRKMFAERPAAPSSLLPVVERANLRRAGADLVPLPECLTAHGLHHSFASLLVSTGEDPRYVMGQLGHTDPAFTLRLYAHAMSREAGERERLRVLLGHGGDAKRVASNGRGRRRACLKARAARQLRSTPPGVGPAASRRGSELAGDGLGPRRSVSIWRQDPGDLG